MRPYGEAVRNLEQSETGEIRRLQCPTCGQRSFASMEQLRRHELGCVPRHDAQPDDLDDLAPR